MTRAQISVSAVVVWLSYIAIGITLHRTHGHYRAGYAVLLSLLLIVLIVRVFLASRASFAGPRFTRLALGATLFVFSVRLWHDTDLIYALPGRALSAIPIFLGLTLAGSGLLFLLSLRGPAKRMTRFLSAIVFLSLIAAQFLTLKATPNPKIDVYTSTAAAARYLIAGKNPYPQKYEDIYRGAYRYEPLFPYWPATLYWITPFEYFFGDIRFGLLLAEILTALGLGLLARRLGLDEWHQWGFSLVWLSFPVSLFVLEQSWIDPLLTFLLTLTGLCLLSRRWWALGLSLGFLVATKQYAPLVAMGITAWVLAQHGARVAAKVAVISLGVFAALLAPFLLLDADSFIRNTVTVFFFGISFRTDSLSFVAYCFNRWGVRLPECVGVILTLTLAVLFTARAAIRVRASRPGKPAFPLAESWLGLATLYLAFFLFGRQAFCNYYYFVAFVLLLALLFGQAKVPLPDHGNSPDIC